MVVRSKVATRALATLLVAVSVLAGCSRDEVPDEVEEESDDTAAGEEEPEPPAEEAPDTRPFSPLTGERVDQEVVERPVLIAKIDNHPAARPQSGLDAADIVFEEVVEGGITRFFVLVHSELPEVLGPIRSARPVDTQLMSGYGASGFAFSGARGEVQSMLAGTPSVRVTEGEPGFFRDQTRRAPHNLYVRPTETVLSIVSRGGQPLDDAGWVFEEDVPSGEVRCAATEPDCEQPGGELQVRMSKAFSTGWEYDPGEGVYRRLQNGQPFPVTGDGRVGAANVVMLVTRHYIGASGYPETDVITDDSRAVVLRDGRLYEARWAKTGPLDALRILTPGGLPFPLKPGATWLHLADAAALPTFGG